MVILVAPRRDPGSGPDLLGVHLPVLSCTVVSEQVDVQSSLRATGQGGQPHGRAVKAQATGPFAE
jgi:hypothetical protein